jgi:all-trans-8'-apo-beta-carotenal 15,15'-oxygenase
MTDLVGLARTDELKISEGSPLGEFQALHHEHDYTLSPEFGAIPAGLRGTLYRNGAGRWESGGSPVGHLFDGDGMVCMFVFDGQTVRFRNRYVRTRNYVAGNRSHGPAGRGFGTMRGDGGIRANAFRRPVADFANTGVFLHAGKLLALFEIAKPHSLDPDTLCTNGIYDYAGRLRGLGAFSAHPKVDRRTGELFNFGFTMWPRPGYNVYRVDPAGKLRTLTRLPVFPPLLNHDFALTDRFLVFVIDPIVISPTGILPVLAGLKPMHDAIRFQAPLGTEIVLVPRDGGPIRRIRTDALLHFHVANAYDDGSDTVIEIVRYTDDFDSVWAAFRGAFKQLRLNPVFGGPLTRLRITKTGRVVREDLNDRRLEFPQIDSRFCGRRHRYSYATGIAEVTRLVLHRRPSDACGVTGAHSAASTVGAVVNPAGITTFDHRTGSQSTYAVPGYGSVCEPTFVPRTPDAPEGDGWLITVEYLRAENRSRLVVLDAKSPERGPCYIGGFRHPLPIGLHGMFTPRVASPH